MNECKRPESFSILQELDRHPITVSTQASENGDLGPAGVAFVPKGFSPLWDSGNLLSVGDLLVTNFRNSQNLRGLGTTVLQITPTGKVSTFFVSSIPGLNGALAVLKKGYVLVGNLPTEDGQAETLGVGSIQIVDATGTLLTTISDSKLLPSPWFLCPYEKHPRSPFVSLFVSNVTLGNIVRLELQFQSQPSVTSRAGSRMECERPTITVSQSPVVIASGFSSRLDRDCFALGPAGLTLRDGTLYVASMLDNAIFAIENPFERIPSRTLSRGKMVFLSGETLHGPLGLVAAPNGQFLVTNSDFVNPHLQEEDTKSLMNKKCSSLIEFAASDHPRYVSAQLKSSKSLDNIPSFFIWP